MQTVRCYAQVHNYAAHVFSDTTYRRRTPFDKDNARTLIMDTPHIIGKAWFNQDLFDLTIWF